MDSVAYQYPETAARWAETISDENQRKYRLENAARRWLEQDEEAARVWIASSSLPEDAKKRLLERPKEWGDGKRET